MGQAEPGYILTLEPNIRAENFGMISLKEDIVITDSGCEFLSRCNER
jgi:Xaa-Pro aminopeptidase